MHVATVEREGFYTKPRKKGFNTKEEESAVTLEGWGRASNKIQEGKERVGVESLIPLTMQIPKISWLVHTNYPPTYSPPTVENEGGRFEYQNIQSGVGRAEMSDRGSTFFWQYIRSGRQESKQPFASTLVFRAGEKERHCQSYKKRERERKLQKD